MFLSIIYLMTIGDTTHMLVKLISGSEFTLLDNIFDPRMIYVLIIGSLMIILIFLRKLEKLKFLNMFSVFGIAVFSITIII